MGLGMTYRNRSGLTIFVLFFVILVYLLFFCSVTFGQVSAPLPIPVTGSLEGYVHCSDGITPCVLNDLANNTMVQLTNSTAGFVVNATTNGTGYYSFSNLYPGTYTISPLVGGSVNGTNGTGIVTAGSNTLVNLTTSRAPTN
jgi:hypothetical protein